MGQKKYLPDIRENNKLQLSVPSGSIPMTDDANTCVKEHSHGKYGNAEKCKNRSCIR